MIDGAMYPTREKDEPWKEVKIGRLFKAEAILQDFKEKKIFPKFEYEIEQLKKPCLYKRWQFLYM